jgi:outer membrane immunogenic protein
MLRKLLLSSVAATAMVGSALAADLPYRKAPPPVVPVVPLFTWTGFYVGVDGGYGWENIRETGIIGGLPAYQLSYRANGPVGGGHAGFNWQVNQFVFGFEGDVLGTSMRVTAPLNTFLFANTVWQTGVTGSVRGRIGWAWDRFLVFGTGGVAFEDFRLRENFIGVGPGFLGETFHTTRAGFTVGGGVEYAVTNNWLLRAEYRYSDYGTFNNASVLVPGLFYRSRVQDSRVTGGVSYKFDYAAPAPVVARY